MRGYSNQSIYENGSLALALAPALTPNGVENKPNFFSGYILYPQVFARGILVLADIAMTRYFNYVPVSERDPVLTAQGDRLRAECFSACNGVYARLDLLKDGLDGEIGYGTTNVDIGPELRKSLANIKQKDKFHVNIGNDGFESRNVSTISDNLANLEKKIHEKPVKMPDRWIRALGNTSEINRNMKKAFSLNKVQSQMFISSLPQATGKKASGWVTYTPKGVSVMIRKTKNCVYISGLHRLSALKRVMTDISSMDFYMPSDEEKGYALVEVLLPTAKLTLSLTAEDWQGFSGEGALLTSLADSELLEDAEKISEILEFNSLINELEIAERFNLGTDRIRSVLSFLAVSGKLGYDVGDNAYFHRELPFDADRIFKDNPRLVSAKELVKHVKNISENKWSVISNDTDYRVTYNLLEDELEAKCTCTWYINNKNSRGPCKHILAVQLKEGYYEC